MTITELVKSLFSKFTRRAYNRNTDHQHVSDEILNALRAGIRQGESLPKLAKRIQNMVNSYKNSATTTARTETFRINGRARQDAFDRASALGIKFKKTWRHTGASKKPRHWHEAMDGESVDPDDTFSNGLMHPCDASGPPEETINCTCIMVPEIVN